MRKPLANASSPFLPLDRKDFWRSDFQMISYGQMQEELDESIRVYRTQERKAAAILDHLANLCATRLEIPRENIWFTRSKPRDGEELESACDIIDRSEDGMWEARMIVQVDDSSAKTHATTMLHPQLRVLDTEGITVSMTRNSETFTLLNSPPVDNKTYEAILTKICSEISSTSQWLRTGKGDRPIIGFGPLKP